MSDLIDQPSLWQRMRYTPLSDAIRGRITGRLAWRRRLASSSVAQPLKGLVADVVRRTRLWRTEQAAVADELIAHFEDGLATGATPDTLIERFGDRRGAAKLIRRSMWRKRSMLWHAVNGVRWLCVAMIGFYVLSALYFVIGRPTVKTNYIAEMNLRVMATPEDQRAWPVYRKVFPQLQLETQLAYEGPDEPIDLFDVKPGQPHWGELTRWLMDHRAALDLAREAAAKPAMGFVFGPGGSAYDTGVWPQRQPAAPEENPMLLSVLLPHLNEMRSLANVLAADVRLAREQGDGDRIVRDVDAMTGIADQLKPDGVLVQQLVALGIRHVAVSALSETVAQKPAMLTAAQLQHLAHRFARPSSTAELLDISLDRAMFYDVVQRAYTDDGRGDGRLTPQGVRLIGQLGSPSKHSDVPVETALIATPPALLPSRREVVALYDRWMDLAEANLRRPARDEVPQPFINEFAALDTSPVQRVRYALLLNLTPSLTRLPTTAERHLGQRDGLLIGIAMEMYRREHGGAYPASLNELTPALIPSVPIDRITGEPLHYRLVNDKPIVYSVGADRDDDGGIAPTDADGKPDPLRAAEWHVDGSKPVADGDWVLFPPPR